MSSSLSHAGSVPETLRPPIQTLERQISALTTLTQQNPSIFASPLGRVTHGARHAWMPRFVFFGPNTSDESWRLAFLAGFDAKDVRASVALLNLVHSLAEHADDGYGLNLTFFPLVDVAGALLNAPSRSLGAAHWANAAAPEIGLLEKDARLRGYHGFVRVETAPPGDDLPSVRVREPSSVMFSPDVELISSDELAPYAVRFEREAFHGPAADGPLSIADDLVTQPFELTFRIPAGWSEADYQTAVNIMLSRFILRYRAFQAYGQHL